MNDTPLLDGNRVMVTTLVVLVALVLALLAIAVMQAHGGGVADIVPPMS